MVTTLRIWSLYDMLHFPVAELIKCISNFNHAAPVIEQSQDPRAWHQWLEDQPELFDVLEVCIDKFKLKTTEGRLEILKHRVDLKLATNQLRAGEIRALVDTLISELKTKRFLYVTADQVTFFKETPTTYFGELPRCFYSKPITDDMREALQCMAFERGTACVFHCCRILESVVKEILWTAVGQPKDLGAVSQGLYHQAIENEIRSQRDEQSRTWGADWRNKVDFLTTVGSALSMIKDVERNEVCHAGAMYPLDRANEILAGTRSVLKRVAEHIDDNAEYQDEKPNT